MTVRIAPAARALINQANRRAPRRKIASDGLRGDARHERDSPLSWHLPRVSGPSGAYGAYDALGRPWVRHDNGTVFGVDLTHDPDGGIDAHALARAAVARRDRRVMEVISEGRIWTKARMAEGWRPYGGQNQHATHAHITVDPRYADDVSPWWQEEKDMTPEQAAQLNDVFNTARNIGNEVRALRGEVGRLRDELAKAVADELHRRAAE